MLFLLPDILCAGSDDEFFRGRQTRPSRCQSLISGCLSYRILDSEPDGTQTTLTVRTGNIRNVGVRSGSQFDQPEFEFAGINTAGFGPPGPGFRLYNLDVRLFQIGAKLAFSLDCLKTSLTGRLLTDARRSQFETPRCGFNGLFTGAIFTVSFQFLGVVGVKFSSEGSLD